MCEHWGLCYVFYCFVVCTTNVWVSLCVYIQPMTYWSPYSRSLWQTNELGIPWVAFPFTSNNTTNTHYVHIVLYLIQNNIFWKSPFYWCPLGNAYRFPVNGPAKFPKAAQCSQVGTLLLTLVLVVFLATSSTNGICIHIYIIYF